MRANLQSLGREGFEEFCQALLREEFPTLQPFSAPDKGMDAYDPHSHTIFQVYFPVRHPRKDKVAADLEKAGKKPRPCKKWVLLLPKNPTPSFKEWIENEQKRRYPFAIAVWGSTEIDHLLRKHPRVRKAFFHKWGRRFFAPLGGYQSEGLKANQAVACLFRRPSVER